MTDGVRRQDESIASACNLNPKATVASVYPGAAKIELNIHWIVVVRSTMRRSFLLKVDFIDPREIDGATLIKGDDTTGVGAEL